MFENLSDFKKNLYINIAITAGVIVVFSAFYVLTRMNINNEVSLISEINSKRAYVTQSSENLAMLVKDASIAHNYANIVSTLVPNHDYLISSFSNDIGNIAKKDNVSLSFIFGAETPPNGGQLGSIAFSAIMDGTVGAISQFLQDVEGRYYSLRINSMDINRISSDTIRASANGQISFKSQ